MTFNNLGIVYHHQERWKEAEVNSLQSLEIKRILGDKPGKAQALNSLASAYYRQEQWNTAEKVYLMSLTVYRELGDRHGEGRTFFNLALLMMHQQKLDEALIFAREAVKAFAQTEDKGNLAVAKELVKD